jgi:porphobilinogen deaminase
MRPSPLDGTPRGGGAAAARGTSSSPAPRMPRGLRAPLAPWVRSHRREAGAALVSGKVDTRIGYVTSGKLDAPQPGVPAARLTERSLLAALEARCSARVGAVADLMADGQISELRPRGAVGTTDGTARSQMSTTGPVPAPDDEARAAGRVPGARVLAKCAAGPMGERTP